MKSRSIARPLIGLSGSLMTIEQGPYFGRERTFINHDYIRALESANAIPVVLPVVKNLELVNSYVQTIDALVLTGGHDVHPFHYHAEPHKKLLNTCPERDIFEYELIKIAMQQGKPILGICRGLQLLNTFFGGTLYQDIPTEIPHALQHEQLLKPIYPNHTVEIIQGTLLHQIFGETIIQTNSFHHQTIKQLAAGFTINAQSTDGLIEAISKNGPAFILGVQWHPEFMIESRPTMLKIFQTLVDYAINNKKASDQIKIKH